MSDAPARRDGGIKVLVCGGRDYDDLGNIWGQLDAHHALSGPITLVIYGGATGADDLAYQWAIYNSVPSECFPANGPLRNQQMLDDAKPDLMLAFPGGRGTANMVKVARAAGVKVEVVGA